MPVTIFDFDETMPVSASVDVNPPSLLPLTSTSASVTPKQLHPAKMIEKGFTPRMTSSSRIPSSTTELKRPTSALPNRSSGTLPLRFGSARRHPSASSVVNNAFLSPLPADNLERAPRLPISRSVGFQNLPGVSIPTAASRIHSQEAGTNEKDVVINALRERLVEVEKERDQARKIVTEVRRALRNVESGLLHNSAVVN
jgi:hypothetical protein